MNEGLTSRIRGSLQAKREALRGWARASRPEKVRAALGPDGPAPFERHLAVIDGALAQAEQETLGICTVCHEPVDAQLIEMDYTSCVCLDHLSTQERRDLEAELELAGAVQRALLPQRPPQFPGLEVAAFSRPAQIVGGDYFDFFSFPGGRPGVVISDVVGHGLSSSLIMASLQTMLRTLALEHSSPAELTARVNRLCLHNIQFTTFITLFLAAFDIPARQLTYCNAGHNPPLLLRAAGRSRPVWLKPTGAAVGIAEESSYRDETISLEAGDRLLLYTDGVTETANPAGRFFGADRLAGLTSIGSERPAQELVQAVRRAVEDFAGGGAPSDDLTLVAVRIEP